MTTPGESTVTEAPDEATQPDATYFVRMAMNITAPSPAASVVGMIDQFTEFGMRNWTYRVDRKREGQEPEFVGYFNGFGEPAEIDVDIHDDDEEPTDEPAVQTVELPPVDENETSETDDRVGDEELISYAESLSNPSD